MKRMRENEENERERARRRLRSEAAQASSGRPKSDRKIQMIVLNIGKRTNRTVSLFVSLDVCKARSRLLFREICKFCSMN